MVGDTFRVSCTACHEHYIITGSSKPLFCPGCSNILKKKFIQQEEDD